MSVLSSAPPAPATSPPPADSAAAARRTVRASEAVPAGAASTLLKKQGANGSTPPDSRRVSNVGHHAVAASVTATVMTSTVGEGAASALARKKPPPDWVCFCCSKRNGGESSNCCVCGRSRTYVIRREVLPLHGDAGLYYRKEQVAALYDQERGNGDIGETDENGWSSLHYVSAMGNRGLLLELLELGASVSAGTELGLTPLHLAAQSGVLDSVTACLTAGANINAQTKCEMSTPLHLAIECLHKHVAFYLVDAGANVNPPNRVGRTPLHAACATGQFDIAAYLVRNGADVRAFDAHGWNARQIAELHGHRDIEEMIVRCTMEVSQAIIVDMPAAEWHSSLWNDVKRNYQARGAALRMHGSAAADTASLPSSVSETGASGRLGPSAGIGMTRVSKLARSAAMTLSK